MNVVMPHGQVATVVLAVALLLAGCSGPVAAPLPSSALPSPESTAVPSSPSATVVPFAAATAAMVLSPTPTATAIPDEVTPARPATRPAAARTAAAATAALVVVPATATAMVTAAATEVVPTVVGPDASPTRAPPRASAVRATQPAVVPSGARVATPTNVPRYSGRIDVGLDPGHSRADPGASGGGLVEHQLTLQLAFKIRERLQARGFAVVLTRTDDRPLTAYHNPDEITRIRLEQEARIAAAAGARVYVSLHFNGSGDPRVGGTTMYYNPDNHGAASQQLAEAIRGEIVARLRAVSGYELEDHGTRSDLTAGKPYGHFFSLRGPLPSVLGEPLFLSNPREAALLAREETLDVLADAYAAGIEAYLGAVG